MNIAETIEKNKTLKEYVSKQQNKKAPNFRGFNCFEIKITERQLLPCV